MKSLLRVGSIVIQARLALPQRPSAYYQRGHEAELFPFVAKIGSTMRRAINSLTILIRSATTMTVVLCTAVGVVLLPPSVAELSPRLTAGEMTLVGAEEFTGSWGTPLDPAYWGYDLGGGGWGNNELQTYTSNRDNVRLNGTGLLVIEARRSGNSYTSARVVTRGKVDFRYGLVEARIKMPEGQGLLPAMWMLGSNITTVGYPACGESTSWS